MILIDSTSLINGNGRCLFNTTVHSNAKKSPKIVPKIQVFESQYSTHKHLCIKQVKRKIFRHENVKNIDTFKKDKNGFFR